MVGREAVMLRHLHKQNNDSYGDRREPKRQDTHAVKCSLMI